MDKTEITVGDLKAVNIDSLNWQLFERREIRKTNNAGGKNRVGEVDWMPLPAYFGRLDAAIGKMRQLYRERGLDSSGLDEAVGQLAKLDKAFARELGRALRAAGRG